GDALLLARRDLVVRYEFGVTPQRYFSLRGELLPSGRMRPGASLYTEVDCARDVQYGAALAAIGLCDAEGVLPGSGTFLSRAYAGAANRRPAGVRLASLRLVRPTATAAGAVTATLRVARGHRYRAAGHVVSIALVDGAGRPVAVDALAHVHTTADRAGNVRSVRLDLPAGLRLPARPRAYVVTDVFPLASRVLTP
ncbi:MAG TPA: hypothetical protein VGI54_03345, partial [Solirubrobacteraceae bacterium]